jgi:hypothetical protein
MRADAWRRTKTQLVRMNQAATAGIDGQVIGESGHFNDAQARIATRPRRFIASVTPESTFIDDRRGGPRCRGFSVTRLYVVDAVVLGARLRWLRSEGACRCDWSEFFDKIASLRYCGGLSKSLESDVWSVCSQNRDAFLNPARTN